jgi:hypothetical protein
MSFLSPRSINFFFLLRCRPSDGYCYWKGITLAGGPGGSVVENWWLASIALVLFDLAKKTLRMSRFYSFFCFFFHSLISAHIFIRQFMSVGYTMKASDLPSSFTQCMMKKFLIVAFSRACPHPVRISFFNSKIDISSYGVF